MIATRYRQCRDKLLVFLERAEVPYDNNGSERELRDLMSYLKHTRN